jgi:hypothetical protein
MTGLIQDVRYALRQLRKNPGFAAVAVLTLALGIGANTAIFTVVDSVILRALPYKDSARIYRIWGRVAVSRTQRTSGFGPGIPRIQEEPQF